jgi:hypothetical protein
MCVCALPTTLSRTLRPLFARYFKHVTVIKTRGGIVTMQALVSKDERLIRRVGVNAQSNFGYSLERGALRREATMCHTVL